MLNIILKLVNFYLKRLEYVFTLNNEVKNN